jgi:uncharacterized protein (DUF1330 family)
MRMAAERTRHVRIVGLHVKDDALYVRYREGMTPILQRYGGAFGYDFAVSQVLKSETPAFMNRVFTLLFPDAAALDRFFADPEYRAVRAEFFEPAVGAITQIASFDQPVPKSG